MQRARKRVLISMKSPDTNQPLEKPEFARETPSPQKASLFLRLWTYAGPEKPLSALSLDQDPALEDLIVKAIQEGHGQVFETETSGLSAAFDNALYALALAKTLQHRFLTFHGELSPNQVVSAILISTPKPEDKEATPIDPSATISPEEMMLDGNYSAQILVTEAIYELAKDQPGFQFNAKPVREAGEGCPQAIYELLWTDESTYGHLREAGQSTGIHTAGRYQIESELGRGAMGVVYKAYDKLIGRTVALKTISIKQHAPNRRELIERLKQEAKAAGGLDHPNIITIYDVGQEEDLVYLSMQFLEGKTMQDKLDEGDLPPLTTLVSYAEQICSAVGFAHSRGVIHRDLKPANIMLTNQGIIKVLDFGIAKIEDSSLTQVGLVVGTPAYMAPEQALDKKIDQRTDIFALGSVFYELFTREKPFRGDVTAILYKIIHEEPVFPSLINPGLPGGIDAIIRKGLAKDPKDRFQSCEEMRLAFREQAALLKGAPKTTTVRAAVAAPAPRPARSSPRKSETSYLLQTTTIPSPRRRWIPQVTVLLLALSAAIGWTFYVKSRTGSFPPFIQKAITALRGASPGSVAPPTTESAGNGAAQHQNKDDQNKDKDSPAGEHASVPPSSAGSSSAASGASGAIAASQKVDETGAAASPSSSLPGAPGSVKPADSTIAPASDRSSAASTASPQSSPQNTQPEQAADPKKPASEGSASKVDGFSRRDVPELLRQADAAAARGDYRLALYEYNLILKLDRGNAAARAGLRRVQAAGPNLSQH
jgi:serine/threonine protein kinase